MYILCYFFCLKKASSFFLPLSFLPVVGTADAEIKVPSADNLELLQIPDLSPGVGQNIYRNVDCLICVPWCIQLHFFPSSLPTQSDMCLKR